MPFLFAKLLFLNVKLGGVGGICFMYNLKFEKCLPLLFQDLELSLWGVEEGRRKKMFN